MLDFPQLLIAKRMNSHYVSLGNEKYPSPDGCAKYRVTLLFEIFRIFQVSFFDFEWSSILGA
jgi:hypothetical protein